MRSKLLPLLLLVLGIGGGTTAGVLYHNGFWDPTWQDKRAALHDEILERVTANPTVPEAAREPLASCMADAAVNTLKDTDCKPSGDGSLVDQVDKCVDSTGRIQQLSSAAIMCIMKVQMQLMGGEQTQPEPL